MIARHFIFFVILIVLADAYLSWRYFRHSPWWKRLLWWVPALAMLAYTVVLARERDFVPADMTWLNVYLFLIGLLVVPKLLYSLFSLSGRLVCKLMHRRRNYGNLIGLLSVVACWFVLFYGTFVGFSKLEVRHVDYVSDALPKAFDGYRLVLFSDAHVGTLTGSREKIMQRAIDSIMAQRPDMIVFAGDLQNTHPQEMYPHLNRLSSLKATDGVFSVLGNHDYAEYIGGDEVERVANCRETQSLERQMGWTLLMNEYRRIDRDAGHIVVAGMENDGKGRFPQLGNIEKTLNGTHDTEFIIMIEHDPTAWRRKILPDGRSQLTLSGHTHSMQFSLAGWSPVRFIYDEYDGLYTSHGRSIYVTKGLGGVIPFRFGATGEIVVLTLRSS